MQNAVKKTLSPEKALARLQDLCARAEHCEGELRDKLTRWGIDGKAANDIISSLKSERYLDDRRFAAAFVRDKVRLNRWGERKIVMALYAKKVPKEIIREALDKIDADELRHALNAILAARVKANPDLLSTFEGRQKLYRSALTRGFPSSLISSSIKSLIAES